jgi:phospholipase C
VIRLIESITGVVNPNISAWRRATAGDLSSVLREGRGVRAPRLPGTQAELLAAERQVREFQLPPIPDQNQSFPLQPPGYKPVRDSSTAGSSTVGV